MSLSCWRSLCSVIGLILLVILPSGSASTTEGHCNTLEAAFTVTSEDVRRTYFLSGAEYIEYSLYRGSERKVGPITELGLDSALRHTDAAFTLADGSVVFIKRCRYFRYLPGDEGVLTFLESGENFGGLPCSPDAAVNWGEDILVFEGCNVWRYSNVTETFQPDGDVSERGLPCGVTAALEWEAEEVLFVKGTQYWKFDSQMTGSFHTDDLNLCSWLLCGEADWMGSRNRGYFPCNGDRRLCQLRLNEVTLPGLHNAGAGFDGGFSLANCWVRNHARSILEQLQLGIRYLDIDSSYTQCGVIGANHNMYCGGSICRLLKQVRTFLSQNPHEIVVLTFNHEMQDPEIVIPALTRQLKTQLGPMLNNRFRRTREQSWPKLRQAIRSNKRVFVFYPPVVQDPPYHRRFYRRNKWIHSEHWVGSTWRPFTVDNGNCSQIVSLTATRCGVRQHRELVEVSLVPTPNLLSCVHTLARQCRHYMHAALRACQPYRYRHYKSPNVLLVDYPEVAPRRQDSVFSAVYHQNVRNIYFHRHRDCQVRVDAAVNSPVSSDQTLFFVGSKILTYSHSSQAQISERSIAGIASIDGAYLSEEGDIVVTKDCESMRLDGSSLEPVSSNWTDIESCQTTFDAMATWSDTLQVFQGCYVTAHYGQAVRLALLGLPCDVDAASTLGRTTVVFKGNNYWTRTEGEPMFTHRGNTLDWTIDAVVC